MRKFEIEN